jgi:dimethylhistidine N-methyltransferase
MWGKAQLEQVALHYSALQQCIAAFLMWLRSRSRVTKENEAGDGMSGINRFAARQVQVSDTLSRYQYVRQATLALTYPLTPEDMAAQSMPDCSPTKWHLAHTSWFFETFLLAPNLPGYRIFDPAFSYLFNSYYEGIGDRLPRPQRGLMTRPDLSEVMAYRSHVDAGMSALLSSGAGDKLGSLVELGLAHEEQHQELMLMDILHLFASQPRHPAYIPPRSARPAQTPPTLGYVGFAGGLVEIGHAGKGFTLDNESPRHKVWLEPFRLADRLVSNGEWLDFMADGGYTHHEFWLYDGWARVLAEGWRAPLYWQEQGGAWHAMSLRGLRPIDLAAPVTHVSYYEAEAYATWASARLPTESEWEHACTDIPVGGNFFDAGRFEPAAPPTGSGLRQLFGDVWEWTRSAYLPYPGYRPFPGMVSEYNGKFMSNQFVLRGGSCVTPPGHVRATYRNYFYPGQRWMFSGVRLALDGLGAGTSDFETDVVQGLAQPRKQISPKHFYDGEGSRLFEAITELPEYYPTRTEIGILRESAADMAAQIPPGSALIEFGSGASIKTRILLDAAPQVAVYTPVDISSAALDDAVHAIRRDYPQLRVAPLREDFTRAIELPSEAAGRPVIGFFPGSTIGNFSATEARAFLRRARGLLGVGARFFIGIDLVKEEETLMAAYDDGQGVTATFNKNLLARINRELGGDFDLDAFRHLPLWNAVDSRIEMHLLSLCNQRARVAGREFRFAAGETIHTENSCKFTVEGFRQLAQQSGWTLRRVWENAEPAFAVALLRA